MKTYTMGRQGRVPAPLALALGIPAASNHRQARILVAASSKAKAHLMLAERGLDIAMGSEDFRQAMGDDVDDLGAVGLLDKPIVLAKARTSGPVARIDTDAYEIIGTYDANEREFTPGNPELPASTQQARDLADALRTTNDRLGELEAQAAIERNRRTGLCLTAVDTKLVDVAAKALGVGSSRVYQLADAARRRLAEMGDFRPDVWVTVDEGVGAPQIAQVVPQPANAIVPLQNQPWVWVRYENDAVVPKRPEQLSLFLPPCSLCPPGYGQQRLLNSTKLAVLTVHQMAVHQMAYHGES